MHPILLRIPLPHRPLMLWWAFVIGAVLAAFYAFFARKNNERTGAAVAGLVGVGAVILAYVMRAKSFEANALPIYSYGVMLGLSLVVGWYLTLTLAERDGLPKETMANCYVVTAIAAIAGSRILYVLTNLEEFHELADVFAFRRGGLVAYGGFLGGFVGSWVYLKANRIRLLPWADVAVPSLASGLMITRVGCYLFGCDFGKRLPDSAPGFLKKLGTFPHWPTGTLENGDGAPAYVRHLEQYRGTASYSDILKTNASLPVHPTQIYEAMCGALLLAVVLWARRHQKFRGQVFFIFVFGYGFLRFLLEIIRDDVERGEYGPMMSEHVLVPGALLLMALGFAFGMAMSIHDPIIRGLSQVLSFVPAIVAYLVLKPPSFGSSVSVQLSTSQWIGLLTALLVSFFYAQYWQEAKKSPKLAMSLGLDDYGSSALRGPEEAFEDDEEGDTRAEAPRAKKKKDKALSKPPQPSAGDDEPKALEIPGEKPPESVAAEPTKAEDV